MKDLSWSPVKRGTVFCSPACGGDCTHAQYTEAHHRAAQLVSTLGSGWYPRVWENLGWHWEAYYGPKTNTTASLTITQDTHAGDLLLIAHHAHGSYTAHGSDAKKLLAAARKYFALVARVSVAFARYFPGEAL